MGSTMSAIIRIRNSTNCDITSIFAYEIDSFDFGNCRPDKAFSRTSIPAGGCLEKTVDFSTLSSNCPFTTKLVFANGSEDVFRMNYKCIFDDNEAHLRHLTKSHRINLKKTGPRVLEIIIENTEHQLENQKAEVLINEGCRLMVLGRYNEASVRFMEAAQKANENPTILDLQKHRQRLKNVKDVAETEKKAKNLNHEGLQCLKAVQFQDALKKFDEALRLTKNMETITLIEDNLKITKDAKMNQDAKKLNQEGLLLRRSNQNQTAIHKFDEGLRIANDRGLITSIKRNKADTLNKEGKEILKKAWCLELSTTDQAIHYFAKAKFLFEQAETVKPNVDNQEHIALIDCKLEGSKYFNTAVQLQSEGSRLVDLTLKSQKPEDCKTAKCKYEEAWKHYNEAKVKFEEGLKRGDANFEPSLTLTVEALQGIERILNELEEAELEIVLV